MAILDILKKVSGRDRRLFRVDVDRDRPERRFHKQGDRPLPLPLRSGVFLRRRAGRKNQHQQREKRCLTQNNSHLPSPHPSAEWHALAKKRNANVISTPCPGDDDAQLAARSRPPVEFPQDRRIAARAQAQARGQYEAVAKTTNRRGSQDETPRALKAAPSGSANMVYKDQAAPVTELVAKSIAELIAEPAQHSVAGDSADDNSGSGHPQTITHRQKPNKQYIYMIFFEI